MSARKVIVYIAMSLDGYIADKTDGLDFLKAVEKEGEDYGYGEFVDSVDTVIMGRKTFDKVLSFGIPFPHETRSTYVITRQNRPPHKNITFYSGSLSELIRRIQNHPGKHIFADGGAEVVNELIQNQLVDTLIVSVIPVLLGDGIPLFKPKDLTQSLKLQSVQSFPSGLVQLEYQFLNNHT